MTSENTPETTPRNHPPRLLVAIGTRPEDIKLQPLIDALRDRGAHVDVWYSGQHQLAACAEWARYTWDDGLTRGVSECTRRFGERLRNPQPPYDCVIVQGDTATAYACAVAAFLEGIPVAHVEAGLRTYAKEPHPEEAFRKMIGAMATWNFCPDLDAQINLEGEGCTGWTHIVGNTVIDTLPPAPLRVLATLHRRENWGARRQRALGEIIAFTIANNGAVQLQVVKHPNGTEDYAVLGSILTDAFLTEPMGHDLFLKNLQEADLVVTDSGGLQEEAAHFGIPVLVLRTSTERTALVDAGAVQLVDPDDPAALRAALDTALRKRRCYGDGTASQKIASILLKSLDTNP